MRLRILNWLYLGVRKHAFFLQSHSLFPKFIVRNAGFFTQMV